MVQSLTFRQINTVNFLNIQKKHEETKAVDQGEDDGGGGDGLHTVKTAAHLHIPMASGNVMKIPLSSIQV